MNSFQKWFIVLRAYSWPASIVPIIISGVWSYKMGWFNWFDFTLIFIAGFMIHLGANVLNTYYDYINKVDDENSDDIGLVKKLVSPQTAFKTGVILISVACIIGIFFVLKYSLYKLLIISFIGIFLAVFYTATPLSLKYKALGEPIIFMCFGPLIVSGSVMIMAKKFIIDSIWLSIPSALLIVNILLANNIRDDESDSKKNITTLVDIIGKEYSKVLYIFLIFLSYLSAVMFIGYSYNLLILFISIFFIYDLFKLIKKNEYVILVRKTAQFVLIFGILFSLAIVI